MQKKEIDYNAYAEYVERAEADDMREILEFYAQQRKEEIERKRYKPPAKK